LQVADVVVMAIDLAWRAGTARDSQDPVRMAFRIHLGTLTGRATDLHSTCKPGETVN